MISDIQKAERPLPRISQHTWLGSLRFETKSLIGRTIKNKKPSVKNRTVKLLNLGCGYRYKKGWINADFFYIRLKFWDKNPAQSLPDWELDFRYPMNCDDNYWDGVYTEHVLEHLYPQEVHHCLSELYRTMKPGSWIRIIVPDLEKYISYYEGRENDTGFQKWPVKAEAIQNLTQNYFHHSLWDQNLAFQYLSKVGFININKVSFRQGTDKRLFNDSPERAWESLYMEAQKG